MAQTPKKTQKTKKVETLTHDEASRLNIPTAEYRPVMEDELRNPIQVAYTNRNRDLDPQLVWKGKKVVDWSELVVPAPPLFIQEKVHPKVLIDDLMRRSKEMTENEPEQSGKQADLFGDFNGVLDHEARTEFYQHDANWSNRMILGDSLYVMASLAERENLRGKVQCIYIDPPYGIKFNSNFQWSTTSRDVRDGKAEHITREPEQVKAFRDTWRNGIHSYLTYLQDRLTVARDLLTESGSIFVQIGDENVHRVRTLMDEVFGDHNFVSLITYRTSSGTTQASSVKRISDYIVWYCKDKSQIKFRRLLKEKDVNTRNYNQLELDSGIRRPMTTGERKDPSTRPSNSRPYRKLPVHSMAAGNHEPREFQETDWEIPPMRSWRYSPDGFSRLSKAQRIQPDRTALSALYYHDDYAAYEIPNLWADTGPEIAKSYVVQTSTLPLSRVVLMTTDPGDLVLDPTCGSGTTAYIAEQWGRRWITIDTSRVALTLARSRLMGARYPYYILTDSPEGQHKKAEITRTEPSEMPTYGDIRQGFVYQRVPHITLRSIAHNTEIDVIWEQFQERLEPLRKQLNDILGRAWKEWEIPRDADDTWSEHARKIHTEWWKQRIARRQEIDASIAAKADHEYLYDKPYEDRRRVRVAGPFTVESISPHRTLSVDEEDELIDHAADTRLGYEKHDFDALILDNLSTAGIQQSHKEDRISFSAVTPWPGNLVCAEGSYYEDDTDDTNASSKKRAAIFIGPEFGTVYRPDLAAAAREAAEAEFDILISCAFSYDAHSSELAKLGKVPIMKAHMNADLHMAADLRNTGRGNLFVVFGEPDIDILDAPLDQIQVRINGVDVYHPSTGEIRSDNADGIACWFIDTDYNEESFFVRHAYFLGANDPYKALKTTLKAEINREAWETLRSDISRPFDKPSSGRIAVKVINHLGDEVMKVFRI